MKNLKIIGLLVSALLVSACANTKDDAPAAATTLSDDKVMEIASEAFDFAFPMILMDFTWMVLTNVEHPVDAGDALINQIGNFRQFPDDKFTAVVKPNVDTYYSNMWYDLKAEPVVLSVPASDRYYLLPHYDAYSKVATGDNLVITQRLWNESP